MGVNACPDGFEHFSTVGSERLQEWFVHFLAHFGNVKKKLKEIGSKKVLHSARSTEDGGVSSYLDNAHIWKQLI